MDSHGTNTIDKREFLRRCVSLSLGAACIPCEHIISPGRSADSSKYRRLAMHQEETPRGIMCRICPNECVLKEGEISICHNRQVYQSKLYTMAYGNPCTAAIDPIEKKPLYHFHPGTRAFSIATAGCNMVCLNCQNWTISQTGPDKTRNMDLMPEQVVEQCEASKCSSIAYTYSEPTTFFEYSYDTAKIARARGIKNIFKSNGYINPDPLKEICKVIDAANIDFKSINDSTYLKLTGGKLQPVLDSLKIYRDLGVWLEITNLVVPTYTDKESEIREMCKWLVSNGFTSVPLHFSRFYPVYKLEHLPPTPLEILNNAARIAHEEGIRYVYVGNVPGNDLADTRCASCGTILVRRSGYRIVSNTIRTSKCPSCGQKVDGVWE